MEEKQSWCKNNGTSDIPQEDQKEKASCTATQDDLPQVIGVGNQV